ncbi:MAG: c-type cytochrome [Wolinella sp.]
MVRGKIVVQSLMGFLVISSLVSVSFAFERWTFEGRGKTGYQGEKIEWIEGDKNPAQPLIKYTTSKFSGDPFWDTLNAKPIVPDSVYGEFVRYGYELFVDTQAIIGPEVADPKMRYLGNNLSCNSCHLGAGTTKYGAALVDVIGNFPQYRNREDTLGTLSARINGCMQRSMNGYSLPENSREMKAFLAYFHWLAQGIPVGAKIEGRGLKTVNRKMVQQNASDPINGQAVYERECASCHGKNGEGKRRASVNGRIPGYEYPPLWGSDDTYNTGAGMYRTLKAADYIKSTMPKGAPTLSDKDAYDVAGYINQYSHYRATKINRQNDFPDPKVRVPDQDQMGVYGAHGELKYPDEGKGQMDYKFGPYKGIIKQKPSTK